MFHIDAGNSRVKLRRTGLPEGTPDLVSVATHPVEGLAARLAESVGGHWLHGAPKACGVSVCDAAVPEIEAFLGRDVRWIGRDFPLPMAVEVEAPDQVGPDRVLNAFAACREAGGPAVAVGFGTAVTVDVASAAGAFVGGAILPGVRACAAALNAQAERLPLVEPALPATCPAGTTREAISAGILLGLAGGVSRLLSEVRASVGEPRAVVATGGDAELLAPLVPEIGGVVADLTLRGLALAVERLNC
jgi:type III pantothenate kinase